MAHIYSLTDGTTTITLDQANGIMVTGGDILTAPEISTRELSTEMADGGEIPGATYRNVTQTIELLFIGSSTADLQSLARSIEALLQTARRRQQQSVGARVYLQVRLDGEASTWRTEILNGALRFSEAALQQWISKRPEAQLIVTRRFFWEGPEKELQLSANGQSAATGGRTIDNASGNWLQIASSEVGGVLPCPVRLELTNANAGSVGYRNFYIANNAFSDPANFPHILEGENRKSGSGTITADATCSDGNYNNYSFTNTGAMNWTLTAALLRDTNGRWARVLARFFGWSGTNIYVQLQIRDSTNVSILYAGDEVKLPNSYGTQIIDLGAVPLPPGGFYTLYAVQTLTLVVRATGAASVQLDFMQLTPLDSYRQFAQRGMLITAGGTITDNNIEGIIHAGGVPIYSPKAGPLMVYPGVLQRIYILQDTGSASDIAQTFTVRAYIRERRLTV